MKKQEIYNVSGKRKTAVARATIRRGTGNIVINNRDLYDIQPEMYRMRMMEPLLIAGDLSKKVDITIKVQGGGMASQSDASRLAIAKSLVEFYKDDKLKQAFLDYDRMLIVADVRFKETHKPNSHGKARSKVQKSYR